MSENADLTPEVKPEVTEAKFTQDDVNGIVARQSAKAAEKAKGDLLAELGFSDPEELKGAVGSLKEFQESRKSTEQKLAETQAKNEEFNSRLGKYESSIKGYLDAELEAIPEDNRSLVPDFDDPAKTLEFIAKNRSKLTGETVANVIPPSQPTPVAPTPVSYEEYKKLKPAAIAELWESQPEVAQAYSTKMRRGD